MSADLNNAGWWPTEVAGNEQCLAGEDFPEPAAAVLFAERKSLGGRNRDRFDNVSACDGRITLPKDRPSELSTARKMRMKILTELRNADQGARPVCKFFIKGYQHAVPGRALRMGFGQQCTGSVNLVCAHGCYHLKLSSVIRNRLTVARPQLGDPARNRIEREDCYRQVSLSLDQQFGRG